MRSKENELKDNISLLADGETSQVDTGGAGRSGLRTTQKLWDPLVASGELNQVYHRLLKIALEDRQLIEQQWSN